MFLGVLRHPAVLFQCHLTSNVLFVGMLFANVAMETPDTLYLGENMHKFNIYVKI